MFSDAGGTGRSYHADLACKNQRQRVHYLLEPGWKADAAIQGLGRTNRTNQKQPPLFRPIATNVKGEERFLSTIARRLDTLGAITKGQRQTGGQGLFRADDNLESPYARAAEWVTASALSLRSASTSRHLPWSNVPLSSWPHRRRMNPLNVHRNGHGQHALPVFVANLDGDFAGIPLRQQVVPDARGGLCGFSLRSVKVGEL